MDVFSFIHSLTNNMCMFTDIELTVIIFPLVCTESLGNIYSQSGDYKCYVLYN